MIRLFRGERVGKGKDVENLASNPQNTVAWSRQCPWKSKYVETRGIFRENQQDLVMDWMKGVREMEVSRMALQFLA